MRNKNYPGREREDFCIHALFTAGLGNSLVVAYDRFRCQWVYIHFFFLSET